MKLGQKLSAISIVFLAVAGAVYTQIANNQPVLGLDLQGGVSVVLQPAEGAEVTDEALDQSLNVIRSRVDGLGVAEPEIARQGETILVNLPGAQEQQRAVDLVGQTAELRFRPVLLETGVPARNGPLPTIPPEDRPTTTTTAPEDEDGDSDQEGDAEAEGESTTTTAPDEERTSTVRGRTVSYSNWEDGQGDQITPFMEEDDPATTEDTAPTEDSQPAEDGEPTESTDGSPTSGADEATPGSADEGESTEESQPQDPGAAPLPQQEDPRLGCVQPVQTLPEDDNPEDVVFLPDESGNLICLGPVLLTGDALETARFDQDQAGGFTVNPTFKAGPEGIDLFNQAAALCNSGAPTCPAGPQGTGRLAAVLDQEVISAPNIQSAQFSRDQVQITGDFTQEEASELALQLRFGALPIELETLQTNRVSASIGDDVLKAGVIAGLIGLAIVAVYLLFYYRISGLVAIAGLILSGLLLWTVIAWLGESQGLALTLSGVVGLIVAIGVSADSNIVYFENVKESYSSGRRVNTAIDRAYLSAISTIVKADTVSLIAAALLYFLTIGQVKGFALYLGLGTLLDLIISWMFMRPALATLAQLPAVKKNPRLLGLPQRKDSRNARS